MPVDQATLDWANWWYAVAGKGLLVSGVLAAIAACVTMAFGFRQWQANSIRDRYSEWRTASLELSAGEANKLAGAANKAAADANIRAVDLEVKAEELRNTSLQLQINLEREKTERLKLEERVKPRIVSKEQATIITETLKGRERGLVYINPDWTDAEAKLFAAQLATVLENAGFSLDKLKGDKAPLSYGKLGAFFVIRDGENQPKHLRALHDAFRKAGFNFDVYVEDYVPDTNSVLIGISTR